MHTQPSPPIISARGLTKSFGTGRGRHEVLAGLDLDINAGEFTAIMGPSGSGKSTLMHCLAGLDRAEAGSITFAGRELTRMTSEQLTAFRRTHCGFVFQQAFLIDSLSLMDNALVAALLLTNDKADAVREAERLFDAVGIDGPTHRRFPTEVSGGELARAGIVRAAINKPAVVFADEPTGALNSEASAGVLDVLASLAAGGQTIVMVTHDHASAIRADRAIYLLDGTVRGELHFEASAGAPQRFEVLDRFLAQMGW